MEQACWTSCENCLFVFVSFASAISASRLSPKGWPEVIDFHPATVCSILSRKLIATDSTVSARKEELLQSLPRL